MVQLTMINFLQIKKGFHIYYKNKELWAYWYCRDIKDKPEVRQYITSPKMSFYYCQDIKDRKKVRKNITDSTWAHYYCTEIKHRPSVSKFVDWDEISKGRILRNSMGIMVDTKSEALFIKHVTLTWEK